VRDVNSKQLVDHLHAAGYVNLGNEENLLNQRKNFFEYLMSLVKSNLPNDVQPHPVLADFGCSYGHLLCTARDQGYTAIGVEINEELVQYCHDRGLDVVMSLEDLSKPVDVFMFIDSLYYLQSPKEILSLVKSKLRTGGLLVLRVTNVNFYARLQTFLQNHSDFSTLGDSTVSYSPRGISQLLQRAGFSVIKTLPDWGKGKQFDNFKKMLVYKSSYITYALSMGALNISPGVIILARQSG